MIDAGLSSQQLSKELKKVSMPGIRLNVRKVVKGGISATQVTVAGRKEEKISSEFE
jgi:uncharacterized protein (DUF111 family)